MREAFEKQLAATGYLHTLLPLDFGGAAEKRLLKKKVTSRRQLATAGSGQAWATQGVGQVGENGQGWRLTVPTRVEPTQPMGHYANYNHFKAALQVPGESWQAYNRVVCRVKPSCHGLHAPHLTMLFCNDGEVKIPDVYNREGQHVLNLQNHQWNECVWEMPDMPRDKVTELAFSVGSYGGEMAGAPDLVFDIEEIWLEQAEDADVSLGWQGNEGTISYSATGYWCQGKKTAVGQKLAGSFQLLRQDTGEVVYTGDVQPVENEKGSYGLADFSAFTQEGRYRLRIGQAETGEFAIAPHVMDEAAWKVLNYVYAERCGFPVGHGHSYCHGDLVAEHDGRRILYNGGWHDAGDVSQQTLQTGEVVQALLELAQQVQGDTAFACRLVEEACWGLDFLLRTRFGDGYRAFSAGVCRWTNNKMGDFDDEEVRCHNRSFDNWLLSGVQAYAGFCLAKSDPDLAWACLNTAKEDFAFAAKRFEEVGMEHCIKMEHTYNASLSQYYAVASWAASMLFQACGEERYAQQAALFGEKLLACQDTGDAGLAFKGFFYRDESKKHIVHFNHQAREHLFAQALCALCQTQPDSEGFARWEEALRLYGGYAKAMYGFAAPYGMLPAGVHHSSEADDRETFALLHVATTYEADCENYRQQLEAATQLENGYCVRQFPVWFSFRGNTAVQLSFAKGAAACGRCLADEELMDIAREQAYWVSGKNPFRQSLIYGEGDNYAQQYAALCGETMGEMPVGIQTRGNEDVPYWPMANNATYKEIWMTTAGQWLRLMADLY